MAVLQRFLAIAAGVRTEVVPAAVGGAASAGQIPALNATTGLLDVTMLPTGVGPDVQTETASEAISGPALVNVYSNAGTPAVRNANGSAVGKEANGFVLASVASGAQAAVYGGGLASGFTGLTPGPAYLSDTAAGGVASTGATTAGHTYQRVGTALTATVLQFAPQEPVVRA